LRDLTNNVMMMMMDFNRNT